MFHSILNILKSKTITCRYGLSANDMGTYEDKVITINLIPCLVPTIIHEIIHHLHPDWEEERVEKEEEKVCDKLNYRQKKLILTAFLWRVQNGKKKKEGVSQPSKKP